MDALDYIENTTIAVYENDSLPNERTYSTYKGALLGSLYYHELGWYKDTVLYKGMTPFDFRNKYGDTKEWFTIPLFKPEFNRHEDD